MIALWKRLVYKLKRKQRATVFLPRKLEAVPHFSTDDGVVRVCRMGADGVMQEVPRAQPQPQPVIPAGFMEKPVLPPDQDLGAVSPDGSGW